jgi:hypothetical protein
MKAFWLVLSAIVLYVVMAWLGGNQQQDFQDCADAAAARYPSSKPMPDGQPFKDVYACMSQAGYVQDLNPLICGGGNLDYTRAIMNGHCYRPTNPIKNYVHDLQMVFR